jgi:hypothetical protein
MLMSNGVDFTEDKTDSSTKSTTESASIDSDRFILGKAVSLTFGVLMGIIQNPCIRIMSVNFIKQKMIGLFITPLGLLLEFEGI